MIGKDNMFRKIALTWKSINTLGKNKAIQSAYIFFVLVPIIIKLYTTAVVVPWVEFDLPFNWIWLFFAALAISIANTIYFVWCPDLVKTYSGHMEFRQYGRGATFMANQLQSYAPKHLRREEISVIVKYLYRKYEDALNVDRAVLPKVIKDLETPGEQVSQAMFWTTYDIANNLYPCLRITASLLYYVGFLLLAWVFLTKTWSVIEYIC